MAGIVNGYREQHKEAYDVTAQPEGALAREKTTMTNSLKLFAVRGVDIRLHLTFPLILIFAALQFGLVGRVAAGLLFGVVRV